MATATTAITNHRVTLTTALFDEALVKHLDETKPDQLVRKQLQDLTCDWAEDEDEDFSSTANTNKVGADCESCEIKGTLALHSEYVTLLLRTDCQWIWEGDGTGSLTFKVDVRARFRTKSELKRDATEAKVDKKVRAGILKRLKQDDYVQKILKDDFISLLQATVLTKSKVELEERVWMDENLLESVRRSVFSHTDSVLSVVELLTSLPFCHTSNCSLGHRAKLRLLEDAMLDECEREGEDELIDELSLQVSTAKNNDSDGTEDKLCEPATKKKRGRQ